MSETASHWTKRLAVAVIEKALDDACGLNIRAGEHPWGDEGRAKRWLKEKTKHIPEHKREEFIRRLIVRDAKAFLVNPGRQKERLRWFAMAGVRCPDPPEVPRVLARWRERRTSSAGATSRHSTSSRPRSSTK